MAKTQTTKRLPAVSQATLNVDIDALAEKAESSKGFLPIANFGDKLTPGQWLVTFRNSKPRTVEKAFEDGAQRLAIDASMAPIKEDGSLGLAQDVSLFLRLQTPDEVEEERPMHSLTAGVLSLYRETGKDLNGVKAIIRKRVFRSKRANVGMTCGYDVLAQHDE